MVLFSHTAEATILLPECIYLFSANSNTKGRVSWANWNSAEDSPSTLPQSAAKVGHLATTAAWCKALATTRITGLREWKEDGAWLPFRLSPASLLTFLTALRPLLRKQSARLVLWRSSRTLTTWVSATEQTCRELNCATIFRVSSSRLSPQLNNRLINNLPSPDFHKRYRSAGWDVSWTFITLPWLPLQ